MVFPKKLVDEVHELRVREELAHQQRLEGVVVDVQLDHHVILLLRQTPDVVPEVVARVRVARDGHVEVAVPCATGLGEATTVFDPFLRRRNDGAGLLKDVVRCCSARALGLQVLGHRRPELRVVHRRGLPSQNTVELDALRAVRVDEPLRAAPPALVVPTGGGDLVRRVRDNFAVGGETSTARIFRRDGSRPRRGAPRGYSVGTGRGPAAGRRADIPRGRVAEYCPPPASDRRRCPFEGRGDAGMIRRGDRTRTRPRRRRAAGLAPRGPPRRAATRCTPWRT